MLTHIGRGMFMGLDAHSKGRGMFIWGSIMPCARVLSQVCTIPTILLERTYSFSISTALLDHFTKVHDNFTSLHDISILRSNFKNCSNLHLHDILPCSIEHILARDPTPASQAIFPAPNLPIEKSPNSMYSDFRTPIHNSKNEVI